MRFLKNCNNAAKYARGKYILFLNNDTQVQKNWLKPLVNLIESDRNIGMVGSQLLYPNCKLQEAGGIVWRDGTAANYGRNQSAYLDKYNYIKDVDYISGAAIMLPKNLWDKLGGFDELFSPAYYEDTDLAFRIRDIGKRVVYQPLSKVIHFEGVSNGTSLSSGQKQYQIINANKFKTKWENTLKKHGNIGDVFYARDRSYNKKTLLFVDYGLLTYDKDCGSMASFQYLKFFSDNSLNVKFIPKKQDFYLRNVNYIQNIEQLGIEIIQSPNFPVWFEENGKYIDYVYLNRPNVAEYFMPLVKKYTKAKIIYQGHDLHFLRLLREFSISKDNSDFIEAKRLEFLEKKIIASADVTVMFSNVEVNKIKEFTALADTVPLFILNTKDKENVIYNPEERNGIMFVGGYRHFPNVDGILWFIEKIFPLVLKHFPSMKLYLAGSGMPEEILKLASNNIIILGQLSDTALNSLYQKVKLIVVPLRFGAGVKGKVVEAIFNKVPVVTTSIGAEGIPHNGLLLVKDDVDEFAEAIIKIYYNNKLLQKISDDSYKFIDENYSVSAVKNKFKQWIDI